MRTKSQKEIFELLEPLRPQRVSDEIVQRIRSLILSKKLKAGDRLPSERSLAEHFQIGRLTLREALRVLEERGLVQIKKGGTGGVFVAGADAGRKEPTSIIMDHLELDGTTSKEISEARQVLGDAVAKLAVENATEEDVAEMRTYISSYTTTSDPERIHELVLKVIHFQDVVAKASHNLPLITFTRILAEWSRRRLIHWYPAEEEQSIIFAFHKELLECIKKKNVRRARQVTKKYVEAVAENLRRMRRSET